MQISKADGANVQVKIKLNLKLLKIVFGSWNNVDDKDNKLDEKRQTYFISVSCKYNISYFNLNTKMIKTEIKLNRKLFKK